MAHKKVEQWLAQSEYDKLRDEIAHLKQCQVQLIYISLLAVGVLGSIIVAHEKGSERNGFEIISVFVAGSIVFILPVFGWLIIHKSRSAFRAIAWCKIIEGFATDRIKGIPYIGYETCYEKVRKTKWLMNRAGLGRRKEFFKRILAARFIKFKLLHQFYDDLELNDGSKDRVINHGRIGSYYRKLLLVMASLTILGLAAICCFTFSLTKSYVCVTFVAILGLIYIVVVYYYLALFCHWEIEEFPFSIQAWYEMFYYELRRSGTSQKGNLSSMCVDTSGSDGSGVNEA